MGGRGRRRPRGDRLLDGYAAAVVSDAAVEALRTGTKVAVTLRDKPDLYAKEG